MRNTATCSMLIPKRDAAGQDAACPNIGSCLFLWPGICSAVCVVLTSEDLEDYERPNKG